LLLFSGALQKNSSPLLFFLIFRLLKSSPFPVLPRALLASLLGCVPVEISLFTVVVFLLVYVVNSPIRDSLSFACSHLDCVQLFPSPRRRTACGYEPGVNF